LVQVHVGEFARCGGARDLYVTGSPTLDHCHYPHRFPFEASATRQAFKLSSTKRSGSLYVGSVLDKSHQLLLDVAEDVQQLQGIDEKTHAHLSSTIRASPYESNVTADLNSTGLKESPL
jgi:hypothetical protein